ncbi:MAG: hypothetical protein ACE5NW_04610 [Acidiferrobacterales bacterium]
MKISIDLNCGRALRYGQLLLILSFSLLPVTAYAEHEVDHRYNVKGFVLDENEAPLADSAVTIRLGGSVIGSQKTDSKGYYSIQLHLHDTDLGKKLQIKTAAGDATIRATFTPGDKATRRVHYANLVGSNLIEERLAGSGFPSWVYVAAGAFIILATLMFAPELKRWLRRQRKRASTRG